MPLIHRNLIVPYSTQQMYDIVNDIEAYPNYLQWCSQAEVLIANADECQATLTLAKSGLQKSFTTHNRMQKHKMIEMRLVNGPFKHLEGFWRFEALSETSCEVTFDLEFEFINYFIGLAFEPVFHPIANTLVDAFSERAKSLYGG